MTLDQIIEEEQEALDIQTGPQPTFATWGWTNEMQQKYNNIRKDYLCQAVSYDDTLARLIDLRPPFGLPKDCIASWEVKQSLHDEAEGRKFDGEKQRWDLIDLTVIQEAVKRMTHGAKKYAPNNWQKVSEAKERYFAALMRHLEAARRGERIDDETEEGLTHMSAVLWNAYVLTWFDLQENA